MQKQLLRKVKQELNKITEPITAIPTLPALQGYLDLLNQIEGAIGFEYRYAKFKNETPIIFEDDEVSTEQEYEIFKFYKKDKRKSRMTNGTLTEAIDWTINRIGGRKPE